MRLQERIRQPHFRQFKLGSPRARGQTGFNRGQRRGGMGLIPVSSGSWSVNAGGACPGALAQPALKMRVVLVLLGFHCKEDLSRDNG